MTAETIGLAVSVVGLAVAVVIAFRQERQLRGIRGVADAQERELQDLQKIETDTRETARKLGTARALRETADRLFGLENKPAELFRVFFPAHYDKRPLPFVFSGDYHGLQVLQNLLGKRLELRPVSAGGFDVVDDSVPSGDPPPMRNKDAVSPDFQPNEQEVGGEIYLCSPQVNKELAKIAPLLHVDSPEFRDSAALPKFKNVDLPCWFASVSKADSKDTKGDLGL